MTQIVKLKPKSVLVVQMLANVEIEALEHEGTLYVPMLPDIGSMLSGAKVVSKSSAKAPVVESDDAEDEDEEEVAKPAKATAVASSKKYTEAELMAMETKALEKICTTMGIDPDATEGKNTNKKLRLLILDASPSAPTGKTATKEVASATASPNVAKIIAIFKALDGGDSDEAEVSAKLVALGMNKKAAKKSVDDFMDDSEIKISEYAAELAALIVDDEEEAEEEVEEEKPSARAPKKVAKTKSEVVAEDDLEVGDKVEVYWEDNEESYPGVVAKIDRKGTHIKYDDGTEGTIDDNNTEIKRIA